MPPRVGSRWRSPRFSPPTDALARLRTLATRVPGPVAFLASALVMLAGPFALGALFPDGPIPATPDAAMNAAPLGVLLIVWAVVPPLEALFWSAFFIEAADAVARRPLVGAALGTLGYGVLYHAKLGALAIAGAAWIALVGSACYLVARQRSRWLALLWATGLRWIFTGIGILSYRGVF